jgi:hypothetical protein
VLVEAYDTGAPTTARLINVSARNRVGAGDDILIAGFNISGTGSKQLLFRAIGPGLAAFRVPDVLVDPKLEIFDSAGTRITENDNWTPGLATTTRPISPDRDTALARGGAAGLAVRLRSITICRVCL